MHTLVSTALPTRPAPPHPRPQPPHVGGGGAVAGQLRVLRHAVVASQLQRSQPGEAPAEEGGCGTMHGTTWSVGDGLSEKRRHSSGRWSNLEATHCRICYADTAWSVGGFAPTPLFLTTVVGAARLAWNAPLHAWPNPTACAPLTGTGAPARAARTAPPRPTAGAASSGCGQQNLGG